MAHIRLSNVSVEFPVYKLGDRRASGGGQRKKFASGGQIFRGKASRVMVRALEDVNLEIAENERVGLLGLNGAGKTTLLRTVAGLRPAARGVVDTQGGVQALFNIHAGLDGGRTGYENIFYMGMLRGLSKKQTEDIIPDIEEFTELGEYLNMPVSTYSQGMQVRLGFALVTAINPEILLLDEAIGTGDAVFIQKVRARFQKLMNSASIVLIASHSLDVLRSTCNRLLWLDRGRVKIDDTTDNVLKAYMDALLNPDA